MRRRLPLFLLLLVASIILFLHLVQFPLERERFGFPLDDGWIHATYARNLAERGEFSFNPGEVSTGTTSLLWTALLSLVYGATGRMIFSSLFLGTASCFFFTIAMYRLSRSVFGSAGYAFMAALAGLGSGFVIWWSLSGMETMLFLALALAAIDAYFSGRLTAAALLISLLTLTRPEGILLAVLAVFHRLLEHRTGRMPVVAWVRFAVLSCLGGVLYVAWNLALTGRFVTSTLAGRRWLANAPIEIPLDPLYHLEKAGLLAFRWIRLFAFSYVPQDTAGAILAGLVISLVVALFMGTLLRRWERLRRTSLLCFIPAVCLLALLIIPEGTLDRGIMEIRAPGGSPILRTGLHAFESTGSGMSGKRLHLVAAALVGCLTGLGTVILLSRRSIERGDGRRFLGTPHARFFLVWLLLHNLLYVIFIPYPGHGGRYQSINVVLLVWLVTAGLQTAWRFEPDRASGRKLRLAFLAAAAFALLFTGQYAFRNWRTIYASTVEHINTVHRQTAEWIRRHTPADARIAAFDIGAIGYFSGRHVIDLGGLISPDPIPYMAARNIDAYIARERGTHLAMVYRFDEQIDTGSIPKLLGVNAGKWFRADPVYIARFDSLAWRRNVSVAGNAYPVLEVARLRYPGAGPG